MTISLFLEEQPDPTIDPQHKPEQIQISSVWAQTKNPLWDSDKSRTYCHHKISLQVGTSKKVYFDYWQSLSHPNIETESDLKTALNCFLSDAMAGTLTYDDFRCEFGYDPDESPKKNLTIYRLCQKTLDSALSLFSYDQIQYLLEIT